MTDSLLLQPMLLHIALAACLVALLQLATRAFARMSAAERHSAWAAVLLVLLAIPILAFVPKPTAPIAVQGTPVQADRVYPASTVQVANSVVAKSPEPIALDEPSSLQAADAGASMDRWLLVGWFALAAWQSLLLLRARRHVVRLKASARPLQGVARRRLRALRDAMGIKRHVDLMQSRAVSTPQVVGTRRPAILLPVGWLQAHDRQSLEHVLAHELAHVRRGDHRWVCAQFAARIVLAFNPFVRLVIQKMNTERELACDDWAMSLGNSPKTCATSLLNVAQSLTARATTDLSIPCLRSKNHLRTRIAHLLCPDKNRSTASLSRVTMAAALIGVAGAAVASPIWIGTAARLPSFEAPGFLQSVTDKQAPQPGDELLYAAWVGDLPLAQAMLNDGAKPDRVHRDREPRTALLAAARQQHWDVLRLLVDNGADVNHHARGDETPLMAVAYRDRPDMVALLLERGADADARVRGDGAPLISAARGGRDENVKLLLAAGAEPNVWVEGDESPLFHAAARGHAGVVQVLLEAGVSPSQKYSGDGTPLMLAIRNGHEDVAQLLLAAGADVTAPVRGDGTALIDAARRNNVGLAKQLLDAGAEVDQEVRGDGNALIGAAARGHLEVAQFLLDRGAQVNAQVRDDDTPLINAVRGGNAQVVALLLERGADPNLTGDFDYTLGAKRTPMNQAVAGSAIEEMLKNAGAR